MVNKIPGSKPGRHFSYCGVRSRVGSRPFSTNSNPEFNPKTSDGSGSKFFDPGRVGSSQPFMVWVRIWKISPKNVKFLYFFLRVKKNCFGSGRKVPGSKPGWPLINCRSKVSSGRVGSGQGPSLPKTNNTLHIKRWQPPRNNSV